MKTLSAPEFHFTRPIPDGPVKVFNEKSYFMGEYNQRTGIVAWHRVLLAAQKAHVESWLLQHYPVSAGRIN